MAAQMHEAIALLHTARKLVRQLPSPLPDEALDFLADSEAFLADGCGVRARYD